MQWETGWKVLISSSFYSMGRRRGSSRLPLNPYNFLKEYSRQVFGKIQPGSFLVARALPAPTLSCLKFSFSVPSHSGPMISGPFVSERETETSRRSDSTVDGTPNTRRTSKCQLRYLLFLLTRFYRSLTMRPQKILRQVSGKLLRGIQISCGTLQRRKKQNLLSATQSASRLPNTSMGFQSFQEGTQASKTIIWLLNFSTFSSEQRVLIGEEIKLACELWIGWAGDADTNISWSNSNMEEYNLNSTTSLIEVEQAKSQSGLLITSKLRITQVKEEDGGEYSCRKNDTPDKHSTKVNRSLIVLQQN